MDAPRTPDPDRITRGPGLDYNAATALFPSTHSSADLVAPGWNSANLWTGGHSRSGRWIWTDLTASNASCSRHCPPAQHGRKWEAYAGYA